MSFNRYDAIEFYIKRGLKIPNKYLPVMPQLVKNINSKEVPKGHIVEEIKFIFTKGNYEYSIESLITFGTKKVRMKKILQLQAQMNYFILYRLHQDVIAAGFDFKEVENK